MWNKGAQSVDQQKFIKPIQPMSQMGHTGQGLMSAPKEKENLQAVLANRAKVLSASKGGVV